MYPTGLQQTQIQTCQYQVHHNWIVIKWSRVSVIHFIVEKPLSWMASRVNPMHTNLANVEQRSWGVWLLNVGCMTSVAA